MNENNDFLSRKNSISIKGVMSILIILHHLSMYCNFGHIYNSIFMNTGILFVGVFLFYSGYGLLESYKNKYNYLNRFIIKRVVPIIIPYILMTLAYIITYKLLDIPYTIKDYISSHLHGNTFVRYSWFVICIIVFYVSFFVIFKLFRIKIAIILEGLFTIVYIAILYYEQWGSYWFNTSLAFFVGILFSYNKDMVLILIKKYYVRGITLFIFLFFVSQIILKSELESRPVILLELLTSSIF